MVTADVQLADSFGHEVKQKLSVFSFELQGVDYLAPICLLNDAVYCMELSNSRPGQNRKQSVFREDNSLTKPDLSPVNLFSPSD